jgi:hypothetical protein
MQVTLDFTLITAPTPEPYQKKEPDQQRENLAYMVNQLFAQAKQQGVKLTYTDVDEGDTVGLRLDGVALAAGDLAWNGQVIDLGPFKIVLFNKSIAIDCQ